MNKKNIARYEIQSEIGRGGMAVVYLAHDPNFRRNVAIKLVSGNLEENLNFRERFEREARLIASIEHPAIVPVYDFGEQDRQLYLVMRYMPGGTLTNKIKEGVFTLGNAAQIISQIAPALDAVHSQGIVHRDLKPGNILFDNFGNPAISDFGIAHFSVATSDLTGSAIIGTPSYMSPEQVRGDADLDGRSDIYALGVILFEMLTGRGPFQAKTPLSVAMKHLTEPLPSIRSFRPDLPMEVELILNKALAKDREMRYASASELARELQAIAGSFRDNNEHQPIPVILPRGEEVSTEMDMGGDSPSEVFESAPQSKPERSTSHPQAEAIQLESVVQSSKQSSRGKFQIATITGLGLIFLIVCGVIGIFGAWLGLPSLFQGQNQTASPTPIVLFSDDFSNPSSGWPTEQNAVGEYGYLTDGYHIFIDRTDKALWASIDQEFDNVSIYVDAKPAITGASGYYGLLCRIQDEQNFYYFVIQSNGDYTIGKYKDAGFQSLFADGWRRSAAIHINDQSNRLRADCAGNTLRFYANNILLGEATDADFTIGFSGLVAAALDSQSFEVVFNNFLITEPNQ